MTLPPIGTPEWFTWHATERAKTARSRNTSPVNYRPAIMDAKSDEGFYFRHEKNGIIPVQAPERTDPEMPFAQIYDIVQAREDKELKDLFDRNRVA